MLGTVKAYERNGAWGFIISDDPALADCFVHHTFINAPAAKRVLQPGRPCRIRLRGRQA